MSSGKIRFYASFVLLCSLFFSCRQNRTISFDSSKPLAITPGVEWAVVTVPYAAFREEAGFEHSVTSHARSGEIFMVQGKRFLKNEDSPDYTTWYLFEKGWLDASAIKVYDSQFKAETNSRENASKAEK